MVSKNLVCDNHDCEHCTCVVVLTPLSSIVIDDQGGRGDDMQPTDGNRWPLLTTSRCTLSVMFSIPSCNNIAASFYTVMQQNDTVYFTRHLFNAAGMAKYCMTQIPIFP